MRHSLFVLLVFAPLASAQPERNHDVTPADYASLATVTELAVSPDGKQVAYCLATWDVKADRRVSNLWVVDTDGKGQPKQITKDGAGYRHPNWAANGESIHVIANRRKPDDKDPPKAQVWKVPLDGEPVCLTFEKNGVTGYDYAPKRDEVFYSIDTEITDEDDFSKLRNKFGSLEYGHGKRKVSLVFKVVPELDVGVRLVDEKRYIREFAVTADGKRIAMITAFDDSVLKSEGESRVDVWEDGKVVTSPTDMYRKNAASPWAWLENLAWNPDGTRFAFCAVFDGYPTDIVIGERGEELWSTKLMNRNQIVSPKLHERQLHVHGYGSPIRWIHNESFWYLVGWHGASLPQTYSLKDEATHLPRNWDRVSRGVVYAWDRGPATRTTVEVIGGVTTPSDRGNRLPILRFTANGSVVGSFDPNPQTATWKLPTVSHITWKAPDKTPVGGVLELPPGFKKGDKPLPLVVAIHGGPTTASHADLEFDPHNGRLYFSAAGYAVLCPNYRGSTGYGDKFTTDLLGRENDIEVKDILAGIQHLIDEGIADPDRIGVMGWSNGGYLTNCLISMKDCPIKFKAASSGAGIVDTVAEWGFNDEPAYPRVLKKGLPWEVPENYRKTSPTYQLGNVKTPTLIHVGGEDVRCPPGHSRMLYRALKEYVDVPTQLVVYPGEPHGLTKLSNRTAKMEWDLAWFDKYLKGK